MNTGSAPSGGASTSNQGPPAGAGQGSNLPIPAEPTGDASGAGDGGTDGSGGAAGVDVLPDPEADPSPGVGDGGSAGVNGDAPLDEGPGGMPEVHEPADAGVGPEPNDGCPGAGDVTYAFNDIAAWPSDAIERITPALDEAIEYYNCYSNLSHSLTINYKPSVQTAEANVDGWISFGTDRNYMVTATVMHEIGHTMGVGYFPWAELLQDGRWIGEHVRELMASIPPDERDSGGGERDYITADSLHFWPYGLNYASEHESEWSLINHVRIVAAMRRDKDDYLGR